MAVRSSAAKSNVGGPAAPANPAARDNREEIARITPDEKGHYRIPLPPGEYLLELKTRVLKRVATETRPFTVISQQPVRVDMEVMAGLSVSGAPR